MNTLRGWAIRILSWGFGFLLGWASINKLVDPRAFAEAVSHYRVVGRSLSVLVAVWLPALEVLLGLCLVVGVWRREVAFLNACLMSLFLLLVAQAYARGLDIACGCFGEHSGSIGWAKLAENVGLAAAGWVLYGWVIGQGKKKKPEDKSLICHAIAERTS